VFNFLTALCALLCALAFGMAMWVRGEAPAKVGRAGKEGGGGREGAGERAGCGGVMEGGGRRKGGERERAVEGCGKVGRTRVV
jgi:hypothetical protein